MRRCLISRQSVLFILNLRFTRCWARRWFLSMLCIFRREISAAFVRIAFSFFSSGVAWTQLSYKRGCKFRAGTHLMCLLLFFFSTACKVEAPGHTKTLYHNVCKLNSCHFFSKCIHLLLFFRGGLFFFFIVMPFSIAGPMSRERLLTFFLLLFPLTRRRQTIILGGVVCICGFKIAVCVAPFASSYVLSSTAWCLHF